MQDRLSPFATSAELLSSSRSLQLNATSEAILDVYTMLWLQNLLLSTLVYAQRAKVPSRRPVSAGEALATSEPLAKDGGVHSSVQISKRLLDVVKGALS